MPAKKEKRQRTRFIYARTSPKEQAAIEKHAKRAGYKHLATFVRDAALLVSKAVQIDAEPANDNPSGAMQMTPEIEALLKLLDQNANVGGNLNQIAGHLNRAKEELRPGIFNRMEHNILEILEEVRANQAELKALLGR